MTRPTRRSTPWVGLVALLLLLAADRALLGFESPIWSRLDPRDPRLETRAYGIVTDRRMIADLQQLAPDTATAVMFGNSRAQSALHWQLAQKLEPSWSFRKVAHARLELYDMWSAAERLRHHDIDVGMLGVSEFDLFRAVQPYAQSGVCSWTALARLTGRLGPRRALDHRERLLQLAASCSLEAYDTRPVLEDLFLSRWTTFDRSIVRRTARRRRAPRPKDAVAAPFTSAVRSSEEQAPFRETRRRLVEQAAIAFPDLRPAVRRGLAFHAVELHRGPHVELNWWLLEQTIDVFLDDGNHVLLVELPVHPLVREAIDPSMRRDFVRGAERLAQRPGVDFLPLEESGPFDAELFGDLTHLSYRDGSPVVTRAIVERIAALPPPDAPSDDVRR